jgi:hypothetical protein
MFKIFENRSSGTALVNANLIRVILDRNGVFREYERGKRWNAVEVMQCKFIGSIDTG